MNAVYIKKYRLLVIWKEYSCLVCTRYTFRNSLKEKYKWHTIPLANNPIIKHIYITQPPIQLKHIPWKVALGSHEGGIPVEAFPLEFIIL